MNTELSQDTKLHIEDKYGKQIEEVRSRYKELLSLVPDKYRLKDIVYFKENLIQSKLGMIVSRQYRSAKHRGVLLFPTHQLACEYHITLSHKLFHLASDVMDEILPQQIMKSLESFTDIRGVNTYEEYKINRDDNSGRFTGISSLIVKNAIRKESNI